MKLRHGMVTRNFKGGIRSLFDPCINAKGWQPYWPSCKEVNYCTFGINNKKIWRYNNSPPYVMARWPPQQILPFNFLGWLTLVCYIPSLNKAVLKPRVSPPFAITYFCNHCSIWFDLIPVMVIYANLPKDHYMYIYPSPMKIHYWPFFKNFSQKVNNPKWPLNEVWPNISLVWSPLPKDHCVQLPWKYIKVCGYSGHFSKNYNPKVSDP